VHEIVSGIDTQNAIHRKMCRDVRADILATDSGSLDETKAEYFLHLYNSYHLIKIDDFACKVC
jgi:hypothetical protein